MSSERPWGDDTIALGRRSDDAEPEGRPPVASRRLAVGRPAAVGALVLALGAGLAVLTAGGDHSEAPTIEIAEPAMRVPAAPSQPKRRPKPPRPAKPLHPQGKGAQARAREPEAAPPPPEITLEATTSPPEPPSEPESATPPAPAPSPPPAPTPPVVEFGL